jgi:integrase
MASLRARYSTACASNQYRALQQFFKWLAAEYQLPDPMAGLQPPRVTGKLVPVFTGAELARLEQACAGRSFTQRRDTAIIAVFTATGIRLSELAGLRCSDVDLWQREITVRGKGGKDRIVKIGHQAARSLDRYQRSRSRHGQARQPQLWLGVNNREPLTAAGIYQMTTRRGTQCGVDAYPHRFRHLLSALCPCCPGRHRRASGPAACRVDHLFLAALFAEPCETGQPPTGQPHCNRNPPHTATADRRHHFSHTWLDRGGPEGDLMELNGWASPQMLRRYGASARSARARRTYDRIMTDT